MDQTEVAIRIGLIILGVLLTLAAQFIYGLVDRYNETRKDLLVECRIGIAATPRIMTGASEEEIPIIVITAVNKRTRPVTINYVGIFFRNKHSFTQISTRIGNNPTLPIKLEDGDSLNYFLDESKLTIAVAEHNTSIRYAYVQDTLGKKYKALIPKNIKDQINFRAHNWYRLKRFDEREK